MLKVIRIGAVKVVDLPATTICIFEVSGAIVVGSNCPFNPFAIQYIAGGSIYENVFSVKGLIDKKQMEMFRNQVLRL